MPSERRSTEPTNNRNLLLNALPASEFDALRPKLVTVSLPLREMLYSAGDRIERVYFPFAGFTSVVTPFDDGSMTEVMTIGREGMVGISAAFDDGPISYAAVVQAEMGQCLCMTAADLRIEMSAAGPSMTS